jgi:hypothetical protein
MLGYAVEKDIHKFTPEDDGTDISTIIITSTYKNDNLTI